MKEGKAETGERRKRGRRWLVKVLRRSKINIEEE